MNLEAAIIIAVDAHKNQRDLAGEPYILHPLRVMMKMKSEADMITAVMHDVVEDSDKYSIADLREQKFGANIVHAVACLTHMNDESYGDYINRVKSSDIARRVKIADLEDNLDLRRIKNRHTFGSKDAARVKKYLKAYNSLTGK